MRRAVVVLVVLAACEQFVPARVDPPAAEELDAPGEPAAPIELERGRWEAPPLAPWAPVELAPLEPRPHGRPLTQQPPVAPPVMAPPVGPPELTPPPVQPQLPTNCVPATCSDVLATCGVTDDGCGQPLFCGLCSQPSTCGAARPNVCATPGVQFHGLAAGYNSSCALAQDHALYCWGAGRTASPTQLGSATDWAVVASAFQTCGIKLDGTLWCFPAGSLVPVPMSTESDWTSISGDGSSICALRANGTLWCWGLLLALPMLDPWTSQYSTTPVQVEPATAWKSVAIGDRHMCALTTSSALWCWAQDFDAGKGGIYWSNPRVQLGTAGMWRKATAGCAIATDGDLRCWTKWQLGVATQGAIIGRSMQPGQTWLDAASAGRAVCAVRSDRSLWCWDGANQGEWNTSSGTHGRLDTSTDWASVVAGTNHFCGTRTDQTTWCWGSNEKGALGMGVAPQAVAPVTRVGPAMRWRSVKVAAAATWAIRDDGTLWAWGKLDDAGPELGEPVLIDAATHWAYLAPPTGITADGNLWWLKGRRAQPRGLEGTGWSRASAGGGVKRDGTLWRWVYEESPTCCWEPSLTGAVRVGTEASWIDIAGGCALRSNGTVACWNNQGAFTDIAGHWQKICFTGYGGTCGLARDGQLQCWNGTLAGKTSGMTGWDLSCDTAAACVVGYDGSLSCVASSGNSGFDGFQPAQPGVPVKVGTDKDWRAFSFNADHACGIRGNGAMLCAGMNGIGDGRARREAPVQVGP